MSNVSEFFNGLDDPRASNAKHRLGDLMVIMIAASLCDQNTATDMALFAELRKDVLNRIVPYDTAPSHDTLSRILRLIDPGQFAVLFEYFAAGFAKAVSQHGGADVVAIDGKALRRAYEKGLSYHPHLVVSAFASASRLCLAATSPSDGKGEIDGALRVVELLDLVGKTVTADALHCTHDMAQCLQDKRADYVLGLKKNRHGWYKQAQALFEKREVQSATMVENNHGRHEMRSASVIEVAEPQTHGHRAYGRVISSRNGSDPLTRYFLLSKPMESEDLLACSRAHWSIENNLHWVLDVAMGEDQSRARKDHAPTNLALIKRMARNILQMVDKPKVPISHRIRKCTFDDTYFINAISHMR